MSADFPWKRFVAADFPCHSQAWLLFSLEEFWSSPSPSPRASSPSFWCRASGFQHGPSSCWHSRSSLFTGPWAFRRRAFSFLLQVPWLPHTGHTTVGSRPLAGISGFPAHTGLSHSSVFDSVGRYCKLIL